MGGSVSIETVDEVTPAVVERLTELFTTVREHDHHAPLGEHKWLDLVHGGRSGFAGVIATEADDSRPIGYAQLSRHPDPRHAHWGLEVVVDPDRRGGNVEELLTTQALAALRRAGGGHLHWWVFQPEDVHDVVAAKLGLRRGRDLLHMRLGLPIASEATLPADVTIRGFEVERDEQAWLELNNRAFRHHPEQGAWDLATLQRRMQEPWFDPDDLLLALDESERLVGSNWTKLDHDARAGEIYVIAVDPSRHGSGLGNALSVAGLRHMQDEGMREASLYVDASNESALAMYRRIGFAVHHRDRAYVADVT